MSSERIWRNRAMKQPLLLAAVLVASFATSYLLVRSARQHKPPAQTRKSTKNTAPPAPRLNAKESTTAPRPAMTLETVVHEPSAKTEGMVLIPGGVFMMGAEGPEAGQTERPAHRVRVSPFWMDTTEVT